VPESDARRETRRGVQATERQVHGVGIVGVRLKPVDEPFAGAGRVRLQFLGFRRLLLRDLIRA
jgi:hypothetical protein